jgi:hypothetical protein
MNVDSLRGVANRISFRSFTTLYHRILPISSVRDRVGVMKRGLIAYRWEDSSKGLGLKCASNITLEKVDKTAKIDSFITNDEKGFYPEMLNRILRIDT